MKRILMLVAVVGALTFGGIMTSTADAGHYRGPGRYYGGHGYYGWGRPYAYRNYGYRTYSSPGLFITTPGLGIGFGGGYSYPAPYPAYGYGYYGW